MAYGQDNLNTAADFKLRDYQHAQRVFLTNGYENTPRYKFLFHVYFNINPAVLSSYKDLYSLTELRTLGLLVKNIDLPKFKIATDTLNQYNRKRIVQKKIDYEAVQIEMHDDGGDLVRNMWYNYFSYYYKDPTQQYGSPPAINGAMGVNATGAQGFSYNNREMLDPTIAWSKGNHLRVLGVLKGNTCATHDLQRVRGRFPVVFNGVGINRKRIGCCFTIN